jgi:hypothetical protein
MNERAHPAIGHEQAGGALLGTGTVVIWNDIRPEGREAFYQWHDKEHMVERLALPGFLRGRRYRKAGHSPEWLTLYEASDLDALRSPEYLARLNAPTPQTTAALVHFANTSRAVCRIGHSVGTSSGGYVLALRLDAPSPGRPMEEHALMASLFAQAIAFNGIVACHHLVTDADASYVKTAESSTRKFDVPVSVVLIEATQEAAAERARGAIEAAPWDSLGLALRADAAVYTLEISRLAQTARIPQPGEN